MYESQTFKIILQRMLDRIPDSIDKRPGSLIHDAIFPAAEELATIYAELDNSIDLSFADTAFGESLERRTAEYGVKREAATKAIRKGFFYGAAAVAYDVPIGSRFSTGTLNYIAVSRIVLGQFKLECETAGVIGNQYFGALLPIDYIDGLATATISDVLIPGEEVENDEVLRARYYEALNEQPFGGNQADYKKKLGDIPGVGGVKVFPAWAGGGTVKCTIIASDFGKPSSILVADVQTAIDPITNSGEGLGFAPMGHRVTIESVVDRTINMETTLTLDCGITNAMVKGEVEATLAAYLRLLRSTWANELQLVVRISQLEARILGITGVNDISGTKLNGGTSNITLTNVQIPISGTVTLL